MPNTKPPPPADVWGAITIIAAKRTGESTAVGLRFAREVYPHVDTTTIVRALRVLADDIEEE